MRSIFALFGFFFLFIVPAQAHHNDLVAAIAEGDNAKVEALLIAGEDPDGVSFTRMATTFPVMIAAEAGNAEALRLLVARGADIDRRDHNGDRPLDWAARYGDLDAARLLVGAGATPDPREPGRDFNVPLVEAIDGGHVDVAHLLIDAGADVNRVDRRDLRSLQGAAKLDDTALASLLIRLGADPAAQAEMTRETPLHNAAVWSTPEMIRLLVEAGVPVDARDWDGETALFTAARMGRADIVAALIEAGAAVDLPDERGRTALLAALQYRPKPDYRIGMQDAFASNAALNVADETAQAYGRDFAATALLLAPLTQDVDRSFAEAVWGGYEQVARVLASRGALGQAVTQDGRHALAGVFHYPGLDMFELVVAATSNLSIDGNEAMTSAAAAGRMDIVHALLSRHYLVDTHDSRGRTAFLAAALEGRVEAVRQLVGLGADISASDEQGWDAAALMRMKLESLICLAQTREASRALKPTEHIRAEAARLEAAYLQVLEVAGLEAPADGLMPADDWSCRNY